VEHPISEEITGIDLVKEQLRVAMGKPLMAQSRVKPNGHAIECRINAEDPARGFAPCPGAVTVWNVPGGPGIRVDTHVYQGYQIPPYYDSMIAKLISHGRDRDEAIQRMKRALSEFVVEGIKTTIPFHLEMLNTPEFAAGEIHTRWVEQYMERQSASAASVQ
jgi:acetyl-CoA carboxylase biotin carboxylase subunit